MPRRKKILIEGRTTKDVALSIGCSTQFVYNVFNSWTKQRDMTVDDIRMRYDGYLEKRARRVEGSTLYEIALEAGVTRHTMLQRFKKLGPTHATKHNLLNLKSFELIGDRTMDYWSEETGMTQREVGRAIAYSRKIGFSDSDIITKLVAISEQRIKEAEKLKEIEEKVSDDKQNPQNLINNFLFGRPLS